MGDSVNKALLRGKILALGDADCLFFDLFEDI